jgi:hypothetical protein
MTNYITYKDIPGCIQSVSKDAPPNVLVSKYQAYLHKKLIEYDDRPLSIIGRFLDKVYYGLLLLILLLVANNLFLLSYFHDMDEISVSRIQYKDHNGKVLIVFDRG